MTSKVKNKDAIRRKVERMARLFVTDPKELDKSATSIQSTLREGLREGEQPDDKKMPGNKRSTTTRRERLATVNKTSKYYSANKSNATFTGDLIRKIFAKAKGKYIEIYGSGNHKAYKGIRGKKLKGSDAPIADIISGFNDRGVTLLFVTKKAKQRIAKQFLRFLRRKRT